MILACLFFKLVFYSKSNITYVCLLFLEIKYKAKYYQEEPSSIFIHWTYKGKFIKKKIVNLPMRKKWIDRMKSIKDTLKAFHDFKNKRKSVWSNIFWYVKVCIF